MARGAPRGANPANRRRPSAKQRRIIGWLFMETRERKARQEATKL